MTRPAWVRLSPLGIKLWRDLWRLRAQAVAIALVIAAGVGMAVMSAGMMRSIEDTRDAYYDRYRFASVRNARRPDIATNGRLALQRAIERRGHVNALQDAGIDGHLGLAGVAGNIGIVPDGAATGVGRQHQHMRAEARRIYLRPGAADFDTVAHDDDALVRLADDDGQRPGRHDFWGPAIGFVAGQRHMCFDAAADAERRQHAIGRIGGDGAGATRHDHRHAGGGDGEQFLRKLQRQMDAAMAFGVAGQPAGVQRDTVPGQPFLKFHRRVVVEARMMVGILLQDGEHAGGRFMAGLAGRNRRHANANAVAVNGSRLARQIDHDDNRPGRRQRRRKHPLPWLQRIGGLGEVERRRHRRALSESRRQRQEQCGANKQAAGQIHGNTPLSARRAAHQYCLANRNRPTLPSPPQTTTPNRRPIHAITAIASTTRKVSRSVVRTADAPRPRAPAIPSAARKTSGGEAFARRCQRNLSGESRSLEYAATARRDNATASRR